MCTSHYKSCLPNLLLFFLLNLDVCIFDPLFHLRQYVAFASVTFTFPNWKLTFYFFRFTCEDRFLNNNNNSNQIWFYFTCVFHSFEYVSLEDAHFGEGELWFLLIFRVFIISPQWGLQRWWIRSFIFGNYNLVFPIWLPVCTQYWCE